MTSPGHSRASGYIHHRSITSTTSTNIHQSTWFLEQFFLLDFYSLLSWKLDGFDGFDGYGGCRGRKRRK